MISQSNKLSHLNLSGMMLSSKSILKISKSVAQSSSIHVIHFSDNGISKHFELLDEVLSLFGLDQDSIPLSRQ